MRWVLLLILGASAPAMAADQFDLACQGTKISKRDGPTEPYSFKVRVDLTGQKWCLDSCQRVLAISEVKPDRVVLADDITYNTRSDYSNAISLDRKTNAFHQLTSEDRSEPPTYTKVEAACTVQPFSGLPTGN